MSKNIEKEQIYTLDPSIYLSDQSLKYIDDILAGKGDVLERTLKEGYISFFDLVPSTFGHSTSSLSFESILKDGALIPGAHDFSGESSVDFEVRVREFVSFVRISTLYHIFFLNIFSTYFVKKSELNKYLSFTADDKYPFSFYDDFVEIERIKYPEITKARVKKMLKLQSEPEILTEEDIENAYIAWRKIFKKREYIKTLERESFNLEALKALKKDFQKGIFPEVEFDDMKSSNISDIVNGLNIYSSHSFEESRYHILRSIYQKLLYDHIIPKYYLSDQEKYREKICKYVLEMLRDDGSFFSKVIDIERNPEFKELFEKSESLFPVILFFNFDEEILSQLFFSATKHMSFEARSRKPIPTSSIKFVLAPYRNMEELNKIINNKDIPILPLEIVEILRSLYNLYI